MFCLVARSFSFASSLCKAPWFNAEPCGVMLERMLVSAAKGVPDWRRAEPVPAVNAERLRSVVVILLLERLVGVEPGIGRPLPLAGRADRSGRDPIRYPVRHLGQVVRGERVDLPNNDVVDAGRSDGAAVEAVEGVQIPGVAHTGMCLRDRG